MYGTTALDYVADSLALTIPIPLLLFIFFYGTKPAQATDGYLRWYRRRFSSLWQTTRIGQTLMYLNAAWLVYILFVITSLWFPGWHEGRDFVRFVVYTMLTVLSWEMFFGLRALQKVPQSADDIGVIRDDAQPSLVRPFPSDTHPEPPTPPADRLPVEHDTQPVPVVPTEQ